MAQTRLGLSQLSAFISSNFADRIVYRESFYSFYRNVLLILAGSHSPLFFFWMGFQVTFPSSNWDSLFFYFHSFREGVSLAGRLSFAGPRAIVSGMKEEFTRKCGGRRQHPGKTKAELSFGYTRPFRAYKVPFTLVVFLVNVSSKICV